MFFPSVLRQNNLLFLGKAILYIQKVRVQKIHRENIGPPKTQSAKVKHINDICRIR